MRSLALVSVALALVVLARPAAADDCETARCAVQAQIAQQCDCSTASNHGRYVSCVNRVVRTLVTDGTVPTNCKGKVTRCAARSTCGKKAGFVTCSIATSTCDSTTGTCTANPALTCVTDVDCGVRCKISSSADHCTARGGTPGTGSCCTACAQ
jgi:hypothetical protein